MIDHLPAKAQIAEKIATATTYTASGGALIFGLTANEFAALLGAGVAVLSFLINLWFRHQHLKIVRKAAAARPEGVLCEVPEE